MIGVRVRIQVFRKKLNTLPSLRLKLNFYPVKKNNNTNNNKKLSMGGEDFFLGVKKANILD